MYYVLYSIQVPGPPKDSGPISPNREYRQYRVHILAILEVQVEPILIQLAGALQDPRLAEEADSKAACLGGSRRNLRAPMSSTVCSLERVQYHIRLPGSFGLT